MRVLPLVALTALLAGCAGGGSSYERTIAPPMPRVLHRGETLTGTFGGRGAPPPGMRSLRVVFAFFTAPTGFAAPGVRSSAGSPTTRRRSDPR